MGARQAVPLTPPKSFHPSQLPSRQQVRPRKSFSRNTYGPPRKCCKQKTYGLAKPFRCNTYKKPRGRGRRPTHSHRFPSRQVPLFPIWSTIPTPSFFSSAFNLQLSTVNLPRHSPPASHPSLAGRIGAAAIQGVPHV